MEFEQTKGEFPMHMQSTKLKLLWIGLSVLLLVTPIQQVWGQEGSGALDTATFQTFLPLIQQHGGAMATVGEEQNQEFADVSTTFTQSWSTLPTDGQIVFGDNEVVATITLDNGSVLRFVKLQPGDIAVLEEAPEGATSIRAVTELQDDTPLADVFYAFSEPGTAVPQALLNDSQLTTAGKPQGWARASVATSAVASQLTTGICNDTTFRGWFDQFSYDDRGTPDYRLNQAPGTSSYFERYRFTPGNGSGYTFYRYTVGGNDGSVWADVDRYASLVAVCNIGAFEPENPGNWAHPSISYQGYVNPHMGPTVSFLYRRPGETTWRQAAYKDFAPNEVGKFFDWHFYTGTNWDWRTDIDWAGADDNFDIGHAVEDL
jgi:hypothetical protein